MTRLPVLSHRKVIAALRKAGFVELPAGGKGSHHLLYNPANPDVIITVPHHRSIKRGTLHSIIATADISRGEFLDLL